MTNDQKAQVYDDCVRSVEILQRKISKLKSEYVTNIPQHVQNEITENEKKIAVFVGRLENLLR